MTFIQALYGSQYLEISQRGKDGAKGRFNGNIFLAAFFFLATLTVIALVVTVSSAAMKGLTHSLEHMFGGGSGKSTGKLLAIPIMALYYFVVSRTVGNEKNYNRTIEEFKLLPDEEKKRANKKILVPFFIVLGVFFGLLMFSLRNM